jgi:hypothetical protein
MDVEVGSQVSKFIYPGNDEAKALTEDRNKESE